MAQDFERYLEQDITLVGSPTELRAATTTDIATKASAGFAVAMAIAL